MFSLTRFISARKQSTRLDGYTSARAATICYFQKKVQDEIEWMDIYGNTTVDEIGAQYEALRAALRWARDPEHIVNLMTLRAFYNDNLYAAAQAAYTRR